MNEMTLPDPMGSDSNDQSHPTKSGTDQVLAIRNATILQPEGWTNNACVIIRNGTIEEISASHPAADLELDAEGRFILPGLIDLHGDAFEREIAPRAGVQFDLDLALLSNDANLISAGITTFYYSITDGYEPGLRSRGSVRQILDSLERLQPQLKCDSRIHLRHEQANVRDYEELTVWMKSGRIDLLSLNNHLPSPDNEKAVTKFITGMNRREAMSDDQARDFMNQLQQHLPEGLRQSADLAKMAADLGIPLASHDDKEDKDVDRAISHGVSIAEFPMTDNAVHRLKSEEIQILMGAPNGVRGKSHVSGTSVREAVADGTVDILCSDYHYPSLLRIPFMLAELEILRLEDAYRLVSRNPAKAVGLSDKKGKLAAGMDADLLIMRELKGHVSNLDLVMIAGQPVSNRGMVIQTT